MAAIEREKAPPVDMYFMYEDIPETGYYKVYYCINSTSWYIVDSLYRYEGSRGRVLLPRVCPGDTVVAFMCMEVDSMFKHYSERIVKFWPVGGGGGGGDGGCPYLYVLTDQGYEFDNSLLPKSEHNLGVFKDIYILTKKPSGDEIRLKIKDWDDRSFIDMVRLYRVIHPESVGIGIYRDKLIGYVEIGDIESAYDNQGFDWTDSVRTRGGGAYRGKRGENGRLMVESRNRGDYLLVNTKAEQDSLYPKLRFTSGEDTLYGRVIGDKFLCVSGVIEVVDSVGVIDYVKSVRRVPSRYRLIERLGWKYLPKGMRARDGDYYIVEPGDSVEISFKRGRRQIPAGWVEDYMIEVIGYYTEGGKALGVGDNYGRIEKTGLVVNFGKELWFRLDGKGRKVGVDVYDITGRCVRRMEVEAGEIGRIKGLSPGVYFVRMKGRMYKGVIVK